MPISYIETASLDTALNAPTATALSTASGSAPSYSARAWVNFNGTGTPAIRASGNVSSITDNGTGNYTVNFTTAIVDTSYSVVAGTVGNTTDMWSIAFPSQSTSSCQIMMKYLSSGNSTIFADDRTIMSFALFR